MLAAAVLATLLATAPVAQAPAPATRVELGALPLVNYDADFGVGLGGNVAAFWRREGFAPYQYALALNVFFTAQGAQTHLLSGDAPNLWGTGWRPRFYLYLFREPVRPYYGIGNEVPVSARDAERADPARYSFEMTQPRLTLALERQLGGPWKADAAVSTGKFSLAYGPGSLLAEQAPAGARGGWYDEVQVSASYDTRDTEASTTRGQYHALAVRAGHIGRAGYLGTTATARGYVSPFGTPLLVLAGRVVVDALAGDVPFLELANFGGVAGVAGIGSLNTVRGLPRMLYIGKLKAMGNLELRSRLLHFEPGTHRLDVWAVGFGDAGRVWRDWRLDDDAGRVHVSYGGGLRLAWEEDYVLRADVGFSPEGTLGFYVNFLQLF